MKSRRGVEEVPVEANVSKSTIEKEDERVRT